MLRSGGRRRSPPAIEALPLGRAEPSLRPLPISSDAPCALALRRIHIVNRGTSTVLSDWEVWTALPREGRAPARVVSEDEWALIGPALLRANDVPVLCCGNVLIAPKDRRMRRDIPFIVDGVLPDEVSAGALWVRVTFRDRTGGRWQV